MIRKFSNLEFSQNDIADINNSSEINSKGKDRPVKTRVNKKKQFKMGRK
ncbi:MAG: hypothetical protein ACRCVJ_18475 [Clostridium sp.]